MFPACRFCKSTSAEPAFGTSDIFGDHWQLYHCENCKAFFLFPEPTDAQLARAYDDSYYGEKETKFTGPVERMVEFFRSRRASALAKKLDNNASVLDIGCGNGGFLKQLSHFGNFQLFGIEPEGGSARRAAKIPAIHLKTGRLEINDFPDNSFDAITLFHVFEHLPNPSETIDIIGKILKPGGILLMSFPNIDSWQARIFKGNWLHLDPPRHLFFFAPGDFVAIMKNRGYILQRIKKMSTEQNPYGWAQSILNKMCKKREVLFERLKGNSKYAPEYSAVNIFLQKCFFACSLPFFAMFDAVEALFGMTGTIQFTFRKKIS